MLLTTFKKVLGHRTQCPRAIFLTVVKSKKSSDKNQVSGKNTIEHMSINIALFKYFCKHSTVHYVKIAIFVKRLNKHYAELVRVFAGEYKAFLGQRVFR